MGVGLRVCISNLLLEVEYDMLVLSARLGKERKESDRDSSNVSQISADLISIIDILVTGSQIFLFTALRALPVGARVVEIYLSRIMQAIRQLQKLPQTSNSNGLLGSWKVFAGYDALLWGLFMGMVAATERPEKDSLVTLLREVIAILGIKNLEMLEACLKGIAWADFFEGYAKSVGKEVFRSRSIG